MALNVDEQSIVSILGIQSLSDERKAEILDQASALVQKRLLVRVMEFLGKDKRKEFEGLLEGGDSQALQSFIDANVPNMSQWAGEEVVNLKKEFADLAGSIE